MREGADGNLAATRIVAVGNQKGGVGKTTISVGLACAWAELGRRIALIDCDPQYSAATWLDDQSTVRVGKLAGDGAYGGVASLLAALEGRYDAVVIDLPPGIPEVIEEAVAVAHDLLVPVQPSGLDILAAEKTLSIARRHTARVRFVLNRLQHRTTMSSGVRQALEPYEIEVCQAALMHRVAHGAAVLAQVPVTTFEPGGKASQEMWALAAEVWGTVEGVKDEARC